MLEEGVLELDARVFIQDVLVLEGESEVLSIQAAAFRRNVQGHRELNAAKCVESCCCGLEERLARKKAG